MNVNETDKSSSIKPILDDDDMPDITDLDFVETNLHDIILPSIEPNDLFIDKRPAGCIKLKKIYCDGKECDNVYTLLDNEDEGDKLVGRGGRSIVVKACLADKCDYVGKWIHDYRGTSINKIIREGTIHNELAKKGIAPQLKQILICSSGGMLIMDALEKTAVELLFSLSQEQLDFLNQRYTPEEIKKQKFVLTIPDSIEVRQKRIRLLQSIMTLLIKLNGWGYLHGDPHLNNMMVDKQGKVYLIDFGMTGRTKKGERKYDDLIYLLLILKSCVVKYKNLIYLVYFFQNYIRLLETKYPDKFKLSERY